MVRHPAFDEIEIDLLQPPHERADRTVADWQAVDAGHRGDLPAGAAEKSLVCRIELAPIHVPLDRLYPICSRTSWSIVLRVMLSSTSFVSEGVIGRPSRTMKKHMVGPSDTLPALFNMIGAP